MYACVPIHWPSSWVSSLFSGCTQSTQVIGYKKGMNSDIVCNWRISKYMTTYMTTTGKSACSCLICRLWITIVNRWNILAIALIGMSKREKKIRVESWSSLFLGLKKLILKCSNLFPTDTQSGPVLHYLSRRLLIIWMAFLMELYYNNCTFWRRNKSTLEKTESLRKQRNQFACNQVTKL